MPFDPAIPLLGIYPKDYKPFYYKDTHTYIYCSTIHNSKDLQTTQIPINDRLDKENVAHLYTIGYYAALKKWVHILCRNIDEGGNHYSQQTDTRTENQILHVLTHKWSWTVRTHGICLSVPGLFHLTWYSPVPFMLLWMTWTHPFLWLHSIPWCICATFSLSSLSLMGIWVGSKSLLLWIVLQ